MKRQRLLKQSLYVFNLSATLFFLQTPVTSQTVVRIQDKQYPNAFTIETKYPDGTTVTTRYVTKTIDGKSFDQKIQTAKEIRNANNNEIIVFDTVYHTDGVTFKQTAELRFFGERSYEGLVYDLKYTYDKGGRVNGGHKKEKGFDGKWSIYYYDSTKREYRPGHVDEDGHVQPLAAETLPKIAVGVGYAFSKLDNEFEKINYNGGQINFDYFFPDNSLNDTLASAIFTQFGARASTTFLFENVDNTKLTFTTITAGPQFRLDYKRLGASVGLQAGVAIDGIKFDDYKENESSFAWLARLSAEYTILKNIGNSAQKNINVFLSTEFLKAKPNNLHVNVHQFVVGVSFEIAIYSAAYSHYK